MAVDMTPIATVERDAKLEGKNMFMILAPRLVPTGPPKFTQPHQLHEPPPVDTDDDHDDEHDDHEEHDAQAAVVEPVAEEIPSNGTQQGVPSSA
jgi:hypothetical protein